MIKNKFSVKEVALLKTIVVQNQHIDFVKVNLSEDSIVNSIRIHGIAYSIKEVLPFLKAYQRILRVTIGYKADTVWALLGHNMTSATKIAGLSRVKFVKLMSENSTMTEEEAINIHRNATSKRAALLPQYMNILQNNEPHIRKASI